jgi:hypothetical protein
MSALMTRPDERWSPLLPAEDPSHNRDYTIRTKVWRWKGGSWHFANLPARPSARIRAIFGATARGWGSIRVRLRIGDTEWATSLFPDRKSKTYLFMIKAAVRKAEDIGAGDSITVKVHVI